MPKYEGLLITAGIALGITLVFVGVLIFLYGLYLQNVGTLISWTFGVAAKSFVVGFATLY